MNVWTTCSVGMLRTGVLALAVVLPMSTGCGSDDNEPAPNETTDADVEDTTAEADAPPEDAAHSDALGWGAPHNDQFRSAFDATAFGAFMSVWGPTPTEVYTVGGQPMFLDDVGDGVAFRFDGQTWSQLEIPDGPMLNWVHGVDDHVWMVGEAGRAIRFVGGVFDAVVDTGVDVPLWGVWAAAVDDVWAVGGDARDRNGAPVLLRYDGTAWQSVSLPELDRPSPALFKIWGTGPDHVFAVGARGILLRFDGTAWTQLPSGVGDDLVSLWGRAPDDIVAVGGRANGIVGRWNGTAWTFETLERVSGLNGSWMDATGVVYVNGIGGRILKFAPGSSAFEDIESPTSNVLHAMFGFDEGPAFAVGGTLSAAPPYEGDVLIATEESR